MENLKKLFEDKKYEEIVKLTEDSFDGESRLYHLSSLVLLNDDNKALEDISSHQEILEKANAYKLIELHMELLLKHKMFKEAKEALKHYELLPYISQRVEELLSSLPERIESEEHPKSKTLTLDEVSNILATSNDNGLLSEALFSLKSFNFMGYLDSLLIMIKNENVHPNLRTFGLILLKDNEYNKEVKFLSNNKGLIKVTPSKIEPPFTSKTYQFVADYLPSHTEKNITLERVALQLLNCLVIDLYPFDIDLASGQVLAEAIISLAKDHIKDKNNDVNDDVVFIKNKISDILNSTPELII